MEEQTTVTVVDYYSTRQDEQIENLWDHWEYTLCLALLKYVPPIILLPGVSGNIMSFIVFSQRSMNQSVCSLFFRALAVVDTIFFTWTMVQYWLIGQFNVGINDTHVISCKVGLLIVYTSRDLTTIEVTLLSVTS